MFRQRRTWLGLFLIVVGIVFVRVLSGMIGPGNWAIFIYLLGVVIALGGLALVASAIQVSSVSVVTCPRCYLVNSAEADKCVRCATPLRKDDDGRGEK